MSADDPAMPVLTATVLQSPDPVRLARFWGALTGWTVHEDGPTWLRVRPDDGGVGLSVQYDDAYESPTWPPAPGAQGMQLHLDLQVEDLAAATARAVELGATEAAFQPQDDVRVLLDPDGHPFCLFLPGA
ncbi:VOC family protein [Curtobacterium caseinilyticum]|uniref:VOC family protein n=1 Tax=Curtobacterium caseinilyticum TaxID=3055137 RepID=A0ABT7TNZ8_9MICO|nr:VOC family protein [Curtobacterium caseinilyticum]MDM7890612.1 VOC family protein [Curtobacterium caseinilyticum]